jgi:TM2 domain-containing membrane protein YozV
MKRILAAIIIFSSIIFPQVKNNPVNESLSSPSNIKKFADYLFCQKDYLRAANEYERYLSHISNDTVEYKIALSYSDMNNFNEAAKRFSLIKESSSLYKPAQAQYLKSLFQEGDISGFRDRYKDTSTSKIYSDSAGMALLYNYSFLLSDDTLPGEDEFVESFPIKYRNKIKRFYDWKINPPEKDPLKAALFSAIIPGAGKIYTGDYADGITAFIATLGSAFLAYDNFRAGHNLRAWIFSGAAAGFYAGNIYGSAASAQIFNARLKFSFITEIKTFIEDKNYFLKVFSFCN